MLSQFVWWGGIGLDVLILARGVSGKLAWKYPVFYSYISFVLFQEFVRFFVYYRWQEAYTRTYWITEFLGLTLGCGVVFEIYRRGLAAYPGTARMARNILALVFALALAKGLADWGFDPRRWLSTAAMTDVEAALRAVQALAIVALVALFLFYSIPFGRNLRGILLGYGLFVSTSVILLRSVSSAGENLHNLLSYLYPFSYLTALGLWVAHLWSYSANPAPKATVRLEQEYLRLAAATQRRLQGARGYLAKAVR